MASVHSLVAVSLLAVVVEGVPAGDPQADIDALNHAFGGTGQVPKFADWPQGGSPAAPLTCGTVRPTMLLSHTQSTPAWAGQCDFVAANKVATATTPAACREIAYTTPKAYVWQFNSDQTRVAASQGCFVGTTVDCWNHGGTGNPLQITDAERFQQGTVTVITTMVQGWIQGGHLFTNSAASQAMNAFGSNQAVDRCRKACYSDVYCQVWQYHDSVGCLREKASDQLPHPLTTSHYVAPVSRTPAPGFTVLPSHGEFIQHHCPKRQCTLPVVVGATACGDGSNVSGNGHVCAPACADGYTLQGSVMTCNNGTLSPSNFTCQPVPCGVNNSNHLAGPACVCSNGYAAVPGNGTSNGIVWAGGRTTTTCTPATCSVVNSNMARGPACMCNNGYFANQPTSQSQVVTWSGVVPGTCVPPAPPSSWNWPVTIGAGIATLALGALALYCLRSSGNPSKPPKKRSVKPVRELPPVAPEPELLPLVHTPQPPMFPLLAPMGPPPTQTYQQLVQVPAPQPVQYTLSQPMSPGHSFVAGGLR